MKSIPVIIDCDPGVDDAVALFLAFASPELDIRAVTTVGGNVPADRTARNARDRLSYVAGDGANSGVVRKTVISGPVVGHKQTGPPHGGPIEGFGLWSTRHTSSIRAIGALSPWRGPSFKMRR